MSRVCFFPSGQIRSDCFLASSHCRLVSLLSYDMQSRAAPGTKGVDGGPNPCCDFLFTPGQIPDPERQFNRVTLARGPCSSQGAERSNRGLITTP